MRIQVNHFWEILIEKYGVVVSMEILCTCLNLNNNNNNNDDDEEEEEQQQDNNNSFIQSHIFIKVQMTLQ